MSALIFIVGFFSGIIFTVLLAVGLNRSDKKKKEQEKLENREFQYTNLSGPIYTQDDLK